MGLFQKDAQNEKDTRNIDTAFGFRLLAVGYILYTVYKTFSLYFEGGEETPEIWMLVLSGLLGVGAIAFGISTYLAWKKEKAAAQEAALLEASAEEPEGEPEDPAEEEPAEEAEND